LILGGQELSSYPNHCYLSVERRTVPGETLQRVEAEMTGILEQIASSDPTFKASFKTRMVREPFETSIDEQIVRTLLHKTSMILEHEPIEIGHTGWMDSGNYSGSFTEFATCCL
jgi:acetylornithine deacetylase